MSLAYALLAHVQQRIAAVLDRDGGGLLPQLSIDDLLGQLRDPAIATPRGLVLRFDKLLDAVDLDDLQDGGILDKIKGRVGGFAKGLIDRGSHVLSIADALRDIFKSSSGATVDLGGVLQRQACIGVSFVTTLKNVPSAASVTAVRDGWTQYFFGERGYVTLDGVAIVAPDQLSVLKGQLLESGPEALKSLLSERTADRYVRDLIRVLLEVVGNVRFNDLPARYQALLGKLEREESRTKAARWFRGIGSHAEAVTTSTVEELSLGIAMFQTNPIIAAAAATYAGTAARKAAQHVFLSNTEKS